MNRYNIRIYNDLFISSTMMINSIICKDYSKIRYINYFMFGIRIYKCNKLKYGKKINK
jgi:hypothetical protein